MTSDKTILIVDDEPAICDMLRMVLEKTGYQCLEAANGQQARATVIDEKPDLILLDWMLPDINGVTLVHRLKKDELTASIPIIMLTAKSEEDNKIKGLKAGADDYITKPFSPRELIARIQAVLRRTEKIGNQVIISVEGLTINLTSHIVTIHDQIVKMSSTEYRLLEFFIKHQDRVYSRNQLLDHVWGSNTYVEERTVDVHIRRLRKVLSPYNHDFLVQTVRGSGYRFSTNWIEV